MNNVNKMDKLYNDYMTRRHFDFLTPLGRDEFERIIMSSSLLRARHGIAVR